MSYNERNSGNTGYDSGPDDQERHTRWETVSKNTPDLDPAHVPAYDPKYDSLPHDTDPYRPPTTDPLEQNEKKKRKKAGLFTTLGTVAALAVGGGVAHNFLSDTAPDAEATPGNDRVTEQVIEPTEEEVPVASEIDTLASQTFHDYQFNALGGQPYSGFEQQMATWQITDKEHIGSGMIDVFNQAANHTSTEEQYYDLGVHAIAESNPDAMALVNDNWEEEGAGIFGEEFLAPLASEAIIKPSESADVYPESVDIMGPVTDFIAETQERKYRDPDYEAQIEMLYTNELSGLQSLGTTGIGTETWVRFTDNDPDTEDTYQIWRTSASPDENGVIQIYDSSYQDETREQLEAYADQQNLEINW